MYLLENVETFIDKKKLEGGVHLESGEGITARAQGLSWGGQTPLHHKDTAFIFDDEELADQFNLALQEESHQTILTSGLIALGKKLIAHL